MDKYAALHYGNRARNAGSPEREIQKTGSATVKGNSAGTFKPSTPTMLVAKARQAFQQIMEYLGVVKPCADINIPPKLETLKASAYVLSLPTGKQLHLVANDGSDDREQSAAFKAVCTTLDTYNKNLRKFNEFSSSLDLKKLEANRRKFQSEHEKNCIWINEASTKLESNKVELAGYIARRDDIELKLKETLPDLERSRLDLALNSILAVIAGCEKAIEAGSNTKEQFIKKGNALANRYKELDQKITNAEQTSMSYTSVLQARLNELDQQLATAIETPGSGHAGALQSLRNGLRDTETLRGLRTDWRYWEMLGVSPAEYDDVAANPACIQPWLDLKFSAKEALSFKNAGFKNPAEMTYLKGTGVTGPIARQMHACGYTREFFPQDLDEKGHQVSAARYGFTLGMHHDAWAENEAIQIGSGTFNSPMGGYYKDTDASAASLQVFKKERYVTRYAVDPTDRRPIALQPGQAYATPGDNGLAIFELNGLVSTEDRRTPRIGLRNVLASQLAQALGLSIIVKSEFSARSVPLTAEEIASSASGLAASQTFSFGISMQGVSGVYGCVDDVIKLPTESETLITMIEESIDLQLFDAVIGQGDRHRRNIMVDKNGHVHGIDNDQCFPDENANDPEILAFDNDGIDSGKRGTLLPKIITTGQREKWLAMDEKMVFGSLRMATQKQRDAAIARFRKVQAYLRSLPNEQVVDRTELISEPVMKILRSPVEFMSLQGGKGTGDTSYFGRYLR